MTHISHFCYPKHTNSCHGFVFLSDGDLKGTEPFNCTFQIQLTPGGSLCLWPKVMFIAETSPVFSEEFDTNKKVQ